MSENYKLASLKRKNLSYGLKFKYDVLNELALGAKASELCRKYDIKPNTIADWKKSAHKITTQYEKGNFLPERKKMRRSNMVDVEEAILNWINQDSVKALRLNGMIITRKAEDFAQQFGYKNWKANQSWLFRFKKRHGISFRLATACPKDNFDGQLLTTPSGDFSLKSLDLSVVNDSEVHPDGGQCEDNYLATACDMFHTGVNSQCLCQPPPLVRIKTEPPDYDGKFGDRKESEFGDRKGSAENRCCDNDDGYDNYGTDDNDNEKFKCSNSVSDLGEAAEMFGKVCEFIRSADDTDHLLDHLSAIEDYLISRQHDAIKLEEVLQRTHMSNMF